MSENIELVLRHTIIDLLDNDDGVNLKGYEGIVKLCEHYGWDDVLARTEASNHSYYLTGGEAEFCRFNTKVIR